MICYCFISLSDNFLNGGLCKLIYTPYYVFVENLACAIGIEFDTLWLIAAISNQWANQPFEGWSLISGNEVVQLYSLFIIQLMKIHVF